MEEVGVQDDTPFIITIHSSHQTYCLTQLETCQEWGSKSDI